jgi:hypothetical protein
MRAIYLSGDYDAYWNFHVKEDQQRLYQETHGNSFWSSHTQMY